MEKTLDILTLSRLIRFFQNNTDGISSSGLKETYKFTYGRSFPYKTKYVVEALVVANYIRIELDPFQSYEEILKPTDHLLGIIFDEDNNIDSKDQKLPVRLKRPK